VAALGIIADGEQQMKILVLNNDLMERTVIQQVLQYNKHDLITAGSSEAAMQLLQNDDIRFVIADRATTDIDEKNFLEQLRATKRAYYIYVLLITQRVQESDVSNPHSGVDDYLHKPVAPVELKSRVQIGERILGLGNELVQARDALDNAAMFDPVTKMLNSKALVMLSRGELERARRNQSPLSILALAINNFDEIKEQHGEDVGRDVLMLISQTIREKCRPYDNAGRFDNSIFMIPLPFVIGQDTEKIAARLYKGIMNTPIALLDGTIVSINVGIAIISSSRVTPATEMEFLIEKAKETLARIKRNGGNQVDMIFL
jgi:diguanylate cyclase (GGDEF)-like protein